MQSTFDDLVAYMKELDRLRRFPSSSWNPDIKNVNITRNLVDEFFKSRGCTVVSCPNVIGETTSIIFYRDAHPTRIMTAHFSSFVLFPDGTFTKSDSKVAKKLLEGFTVEEVQRDIDEVNKEQSIRKRQILEDQLRESMLAEQCELISKYESTDKPVYYLFDGMEYQTTPHHWNAGKRAHKQKCVRYTHNHIKELFAKEGCELLTQYKNQKTILTYRYEGQEFQVNFTNWKYHKLRPHLH